MLCLIRDINKKIFFYLTSHLKKLRVFPLWAVREYSRNTIEISIDKVKKKRKEILNNIADLYSVAHNSDNKQIWSEIKIKHLYSY